MVEYVSYKMFEHSSNHLLYYIGLFSVLYFHVIIISSQDIIPECENVQIVAAGPQSTSFLFCLNEFNPEIIDPLAGIFIYNKTSTNHDWLIKIYEDRDFLYGGTLYDDAYSFSYGYGTGKSFIGFSLLSNGTLIYVQPLEEGSDSAHYAEFYTGDDVKFEFCNNISTCDTHGIFNKSVILCYFHGDKMVCYERNETSSQIPRPKETQSGPESGPHHVQDTLCGITMMSDPTHFQLHQGDRNSVVREMTSVALHLDHVLKWADLDMDGQPDQVGIYINRINVVASEENPDLEKTFDRGNLVETDMAEYLEMYRDLPQNSCMAIVFVSDHNAGETASVADSGGVCHGSTANSKARNMGVVNTMKTGGQKRSMLEIALLTATVAGQIMGSQAYDCTASRRTPSTTNWKEFYSGCQRKSMNAVLKSRGSCLEPDEVLVDVDKVPEKVPQLIPKGFRKKENTTEIVPWV